MAESRSIRVNALTRVEGEGALNVRLQSGKIESVELNIYEPPRLFEALLRGRPLEEVPDITARICGICPVAYQMSSVHALEMALGIKVPDEIRQLRRLLYCGEWIESHALHMHLLHAPDFLGYDDGVAMAQDFPEEVQRGLQLKKFGNRLLETLGGRAIHPINVAVGGFYRLPTRAELNALVPDFIWGVEAAVAATRWVAQLDFPDFDQQYEMVAVSHPDEYAMNEGMIVSTHGVRVPVDQFEEQYCEFQVPHSTALQAHQKENKTSYLCGPLARLNINRDQLSPTAKRLADEVGFASPSCNPFHSIVARGLELVHAFEEALTILRDDRRRSINRVPYSYQQGEGMAATEAPRGILYHRYQVDENGKVLFSKIVPPTSQNQMQIEADLRNYLPHILTDDDEQTGAACERLIRNYDPCISCSTHFLKLNVERR